jgi:hypothetical protein
MTTVFGWMPLKSHVICILRNTENAWLLSRNLNRFCSWVNLTRCFCFTLWFMQLVHEWPKGIHLSLIKIYFLWVRYSNKNFANPSIRSSKIMMSTDCALKIYIIQIETRYLKICINFGNIYIYIFISYSS